MRPKAHSSEPQWRMEVSPQSNQHAVPREEVMKINFGDVDLAVVVNVEVLRRS